MFGSRVDHVSRIVNMTVSSNTDNNSKSNIGKYC